MEKVMTKQLIRVLAFTAVALSLSGAVTAQQAKPDQPEVGVYHPKTHTYAARPHRLVVAEAVTPATYTGTFKFVFTVKLVTPVASGEELICTADAGVDDYNTSTDVYYNYYDEDAAAVAKVTGSTATCTVDIPYSWSLEYASTDTVGYSYELEIAPSTTSSSLIDFGYRLHESLLPSTKVPATGATTTIAVSATL
jgi:hypothetical protein